MPHVASDTTTIALNSRRAYAARPPQAQAPATPFASLLDDSAPPQQPPQSTPEDHTVPASSSDQAQKPAKDSKAAKSGDKAAATHAKQDTTAGQTDKPADGKAATDSKLANTKPADASGAEEKTAKAADEKTVKTAKTADDKDATPVIDGKPADVLVPVDAPVTPPIDPAPALKTADATVVAVPTPVVTPAVTAPENSAPAKPDALAILSADGAKGLDEAALKAKIAATPHGEAKPQGPASDADKDAIAQARGELANATHHATAAPGPGALAADPNAAAPKAAEAAQSAALPAPSQPSPAAAPNPVAAQVPQAAAIPFAGVAIEVASKALSGTNHFEIRLDPPELGRIEVRLNVDRDGTVTSRMIADRPDTLDLLRRDASGLERALQDAGLKTTDNGMQFSLRDQTQQQQQQSSSGGQTARLVLQDETLPSIDVTQRSYGRLAGMGGGVDIQV